MGDAPSRRGCEIDVHPEVLHEEHAPGGGTGQAQAVYQDIADALERRLSRLEPGSGWTLDVAGIVADLYARVSLFEAWRSTLVTSDDILGGEPVFPNSRFTVRHVGGGPHPRARLGVSCAAVLELAFLLKIVNGFGVGRCRD